jgi:hypothetical protein
MTIRLDFTSWPHVETLSRLSIHATTKLHHGAGLNMCETSVFTATLADGRTPQPAGVRSFLV